MSIYEVWNIGGKEIFEWFFVVLVSRIVYIIYWVVKVKFYFKNIISFFWSLIFIGLIEKLGK